MRMKTFISSLLLLLISSESTSSFQQTSAAKITTPTEIHQMNSNVDNHDTSDGNEQETLQLPPSNPDKDIPTLQFGDTMRFEELGPIIINTDGTTRRIDNWDTLTDREKEVSWRRIKKRNEERRKALMEQQQQQQDGGAASGSPKQN